MKSGVDCFSQQAVGMSKFPVILKLIILHFSPNIGDESLCTEVPVVRCRRRFPLLRLFDNRSHLRSLQGLVMVDLLDNFMNILKLFLAVESDFTKLLRRRMDGVRRER